VYVTVKPILRPLEREGSFQRGTPTSSSTNGQQKRLQGSIRGRGERLETTSSSFTCSDRGLKSTRVQLTRLTQKQITHWKS